MILHGNAQTYQETVVRTPQQELSTEKTSETVEPVTQVSSNPSNVRLPLPIHVYWVFNGFVLIKKKNFARTKTLISAQISRSTHQARERRGRRWAWAQWTKCPRRANRWPWRHRGTWRWWSHTPTPTSSWSTWWLCVISVKCSSPRTSSSKFRKMCNCENIKKNRIFCNLIESFN